MIFGWILSCVLLFDQVQHDGGYPLGRPSLDIPIGQGWGLGHSGSPGEEPDTSGAAAPGRIFKGQIII